MNGVVIDLATDPRPCWAVVWRGQLLPVRFGRERDAHAHFNGLIGRPDLHPRHQAGSPLAERA